MDGHMKNGELNLAWTDTLVAGLAAAGLGQAVLAPGARSSPLAVAFLRRPEIACEVITDERVAGYFALGIARTVRKPVAVVCTSGTAAANLLPAIMEANLAGVPLLVLTADRPPEAHGWGANQTADQLKLYGNHVRAFHALTVPDTTVAATYLHGVAARLLEECRFPAAGPVHANLPFREPLLPDTIGPAPALPAAIVHQRPAGLLPDLDALAARLSGRRGVILCGEAPPDATLAAGFGRLAERLGAPILAEPLSNLRFGSHDRSHICTHQAAYLRQPAAFHADWVLRFGAFPVSRSLEAWLAGQAETEQIVIAPPGLWPDPHRHAQHWLRADAATVIETLTAHNFRPASPDWLERWRTAEAAAAASAEAADGTAAPFEGSIARSLVMALPDGAHCFVGNSLAIRAMDLFSGQGERQLSFHGNRGASGIDGNVATTAGIATASGTPTAALIGDQTALHDCGGFAALAGRNAVIVVMDNGGGGIFDHLPLAHSLPAEIFRRAFTAPPRLQLAGLAHAHGLAYRDIDRSQDLAPALASALAAGGPCLLRVPVDRATSLAGFATAIGR